jgi:hypothetical protein
MQCRSGAASRGTVQREAAMYRLLFLFCVVVVGCEAARITESVTCSGSYYTLWGLGQGNGGETEVFDLPQQQPPDTNLVCMLPVDSSTALSGGDIYGFEVVAVPFIPPNDPCDGCDLPPTNVAATYSIVGDFVLQFSPVPAFWSVCISADGGHEGAGTVSASGFVGLYTIGAPCDFAHAVPFPSSGTVTFPVNLSGNAEGNGGINVNVRLEFFDADGNEPEVIDGYSLVALPTVPEPSTIVPAALAFICLRLKCRRV